MNTKLTGGPAFPQPDYMADGSTQTQGDPGMTLRDYFAAKAMSTLLQTVNGVSGSNRYEYRIAEEAYVFADAMLRVRAA